MKQSKNKITNQTPLNESSPILGWWHKPNRRIIPSNLKHDVPIYVTRKIYHEQKELQRNHKLFSNCVVNKALSWLFFIQIYKFVHLCT